VDRDLLSATLSGEMLSTGERHASTLLRSAQQVNRYERNRPARAFLPWRISSRIHDNLADGAPTRMVGVTASDQESSERLCHTERLRFRSVAVKMTQRVTHTAPVIDRSGQLNRGLSRFVYLSFDTCTLLSPGFQIWARRTVRPQGWFASRAVR
jgi:hypothetical protein